MTRSSHPSYLSTNDTLLWDLDRDPRFNAQAGALMVFDRAPDWDRFVAKVDRITRLQPLLRQRVVEAPFGLAPPRWVTVADFDLSDHLERAIVPPPGDLRTVLDLVAMRTRMPLDKHRPLWRFTLFEGLHDGRAALLQLAHHAMSDGIGGMQLAEDWFDATRTPRSRPARLPPAPEPEHVGPLALTRDALAEAGGQVGRAAIGAARVAGELAWRGVADPVGSTRRGVAYLASAMRVLKPVVHDASPIMQGRSIGRRYDVFDVPFDRLHAAAHTAGASVNDAFLTAIATGISRYHDAHGTTVDRLHITTPISIRQAGDPRGGNRTGAARFEIPAGSTDVAGRLARISAASRAARTEPALDLARIVGTVVGRLPSAVMVPVYAAMLVHTDLLASNIPGFQSAPYLCGARVDHWYALGPTEGTAIGVFLLSHAGRCCIGVTTDRTAVPDADRLVACLRDGFDALLGLAPAPTPPRRARQPATRARA